MAEQKNPVVFMDVSIDGVHVGKMIIELFKDDAPATAENFRALCTGEKGIGVKGEPLHYKGSFFYNFGKGFSFIKGGDFYSSVGKCGESIYGEKFPNEMPHRTHDERGLLTMNICDRYGIGSHFAITLEPDQYLDRFHVVFGKIVYGLETLDKITEVRWRDVQVSNCGEYNLDESIAALWDAITSKHHSRFRILYQLACHSYPQAGGDLLCEAAKRNDLTVMNDLLKQGLNVDSKDRHGSTATQIAMVENHVEMVLLLILNGAYVPDIQNHDFSSALNEMLRKCKTRHQITVHEATPSENV